MVRPTRREWLALAGAAAVGAKALAQPETTKLPARAVTKGPKHHWFGYYDKCPWDKTGRYLLAMESEFCDRPPTAKDAIAVGMVDLKGDDKFIPLDTTRAWSWQQGTMLQWLGSAPDREVIYNSIVDGKPAAIVRDVHSGKTRTLARPIYAVSNDGKQAVTLDFARLHRLRPGYGYASYDERFVNDPAPEQLGIWHLELATGKDRQILSLKQLAAFQPDARFTGAHHWVNHLQFNPGGTRFVFLHRWRVDLKPWSTRIFTAKPDGTDLRLHLDTGMVSHFDWRDDSTILAWVKTPKDGNKFALIDVATNGLTLVGDGVLTQDGHCSYSPDRKWILNDTYPDKNRLQWLMLYHPEKNRRYDLNQFHSPKQFTGPFRCDMHPRWNRDGTQVCFDGCHEPERQVYVVDVREIVTG
ncbi:MAG: hypothetical protein KF873_19500 [Gemmataceae bacterium]|nr:hypothetical protein [Gemmataceae bacterium]